ncbi:MAG: hypothetical protein AAB443_04220 [Patescibacteria group bacterium]
MKKKLPLVQKVFTTNSFLVERTLPEEGEIFVKTGENVEPFTKIGGTKVSYFKVKIPQEFVLKKPIDTFIEKGIEIGEYKKNAIRIVRLYASFNGFIRKDANGYYFEQDKVNFSLLSGLWGEVKEVLANKSVLIQGSATIVYFAASTPHDAEGELIVFPNPSEILEDPYFNNFTKEIAGKVIYTGYFVKLNNVKKAMNLGVKGLIAGGCDKTTLEFAKANNFALGAISGFGRIPTPQEIFDLFNSVANRYIFIRGKKGEIFIPSDRKFSKLVNKEKLSLFSEPKSGMIVQVLERPYFGWMGTLEDEEKDRFRVRLHQGGKIIYAKPTNILVLDF